MTTRAPHVLDRADYLREVRIPIEVLRETYDEVVRVGSQREVAKAWGWTQAKVRHRVNSYMRHAGIEGDPPGIVSPSHRQRGSLSHSGQGDRSAWRRATDENRALRDRVAALEAEVADLTARVVPLERIEAKLDQLLARPVTIAAVSHRRKADGGIGGRRELRELRRPA